MKIGSTDFNFSHEAYVMGILNLTSDSFSDGGLYLDSAIALERALQIQQEGADLIDVGAESTRPGAHEVEAYDQIKILKPLLQKLIPQLKIPVSIDTRHAKVAEFAIDNGVSLLNDVSGFQFDSAMVGVLQKYPIPLVLMHSRGSPENMNQYAQYEDLLEELDSFFEKRMAFFESLGISRDRIVIDPGIGFAKKKDQNLEILSNLNRLQNHQRPILIGLSRKSFLEDYFGPTLQPRDRSLGTEIAHLIALQKGASLLRVHDVLNAKKTIHFEKIVGKFQRPSTSQGI